MLESFITYEPSLIEIEEHTLFDSNEVWILGQHYYGLQGGVGPTSDQGWGCMLRCGQMLLAQALLFRHLGRSWRWKSTDKSETYVNILRMFEDKKDRMFSLHQIAQMGVSEGKSVGEWFGPNTVAHVMKKLCIYDDWTNLAIHVAMDNCVIRQDIDVLCRTKIIHKIDHSVVARQRRNGASPTIAAPPAVLSFENAASTNGKNNDGYWRPLLLIVPLRLGLNSINPCYTSALKEFFSVKQCLGIIGGRPNHALYFIGCVDDRLLYLDPHVCQNFVDLDCSALQDIDDSSYHCTFALNIEIRNIDPSLALAFLCHKEADFDDLCKTFETKLLKSSSPPLFELLDNRPPCWPKFYPYTGEETPKASEFTVVESHFDTDEEFEILD